jgi:hypothetical protein
MESRTNAWPHSTRRHCRWDGAIYVAGSFTAIGGKLRSGFAKLNSDGSAD